MNRYILVGFLVALATSCSVHAYSAPPSSGYSHAASSDAAPGEYGDAGSAPYAGSDSYGSSQPIPHSPVNTRGNTVTSSITYPQNKGEILIHRPAAIIVKRPPTKVLVNHPPLVVKPAPVVLHKPPAVVMRKVFVKQHPRPVKVEPVYVNVVKPPAEKYFVNEKQQQLAAAGLAHLGGNAAGGAGGAGLGGNLAGLGGNIAGLNANLAGLPAFAAAGTDNAAANGYQLLSSNQGLAALANIAGPSPYGQPSAPAGYSVQAPHY